MLYIYDVYLVCNDGRLKTKKKLNFFTSLPSVMTMTLGKAGNLGHEASQLCRVPWARHSAKKIKKKRFAECLPTALGKENPKNRKQALPSARCRHSTKHLKKIKNTFLCRVPTRGTRQRGRHGGFSLPSAVVALGKSFAECPTCGTRQRSLCREGICRQLFAECSTRQRLCRVQSLLCRTRQSTRVL